MVRIINAFREERPVGAMLARLGDAMFGDQATGEINRQQAYALQRSNAETNNLMALAREGGLETLTPAGQAMLIGSGYDPNDLGRVGALGAATQFGARDPRTTNWSAGLGEYGNTAEAFDLDLAEVARNNNLQSGDRRYNTDTNVAEDARQFNMTPQEALVNGQPAFVPRSGAFETGVAPIMTEAEVGGLNLANMFPTLTRPQQVESVGATAPVETVLQNGVPTIVTRTDAAGMPAVPPAPGTSWNYILPDGTVFITNDTAFAAGADAQGNPLPPGGTRGELTGGAEQLGLPTNAVRTDLQSDIIATRKFRSLAGIMQELVEDPATVWGPQAFLSARIQEVGQAVGSLTAYVRPQDAAAIQQFLPEMYDPNLPRAQSVYTLMLYAGAAALAGQENRSVTDADINNMRGIIPNPEGIFTSRERMREALVVVNEIITGYEAVTEEAITRGFNGTAATPAPTAPPAATTGGPVQITNDAAGAAAYNALPSGAQFRDPEGNLRQKP